MPSSNSYFIVLGTFGLVINCIPLALRWKFDYGEWVDGTAPINYALNSLDFKYSLVASVAVSCPLYIDLLLDVALASKWNMKNIVRMTIVTALFFPDAILLKFSGNSIGPEILDTIIHSRGVVGLSAALVHLYNYGAPILNSRLLLLCYLLIIIGGGLSCLSPYYESEPDDLYFVCTIVFITAFSIGTYLVIRWFIHLYRLGFHRITGDQYTCNIYISSLAVAGISLLVMRFILGPPIGPETNSTYLTISTYLEIITTLNISLLHGRLIRLEMFDTKVLFQRIYLMMNI